MCRALLYLGQPVLLDNLLFQPDSALIRQSYMPKMLHMLNLAGFGMRAWSSSSHLPEQPWSYAVTTLPVFDRNLKHLRTDEIHLSGELREVALGDIIDGKEPTLAYVGWDLGPVIAFLNQK